MDTLAYVLLFGVAIWGIAITSALSGNPNNCGGVNPGDIVSYNGAPAKIIKRTGPWGDSCNYWVETQGKELVANVKELAKSED